MALAPNTSWLRWLRLFFFAALAIITAAYFYDAFQSQGSDVLAQWRGRLPTLMLCLGLNYCGVSLDFLCWQWMYRRCGVRVRGILSPLIFFSVFAANLLPAQTGRLVRPDAAWRHGFGSLRDGSEAEGVLLVLDLISTIALIATMMAWLVSPWLAPLAFAACLCAGLAAGSGLASFFRRFMGDVRRGLFWSFQGLVSVVLRAADRALLGLALLLIIQPLAPQVRYPSATVYVLTADTAGALSGMPGGLGVAEAILGWFLAMAQIPVVHVAMAVTVFRLVCFWGMVPFAWLALLATFVIKPKREPDEQPSHP